jgi:hypothetical protein
VIQVHVRRGHREVLVMALRASEPGGASSHSLRL